MGGNNCNITKGPISDTDNMGPGFKSWQEGDINSQQVSPPFCEMDKGEMNKALEE